MTTFLSGYVGRLTALSANLVPTEQAGTGYARQAVTLAYDPVANIVTVLNGYSFENTGGSTWTQDAYEAIFDAASGGNMLLVYPITETAIPAGDTASEPALQKITNWAISGAVTEIAAGAQAGLVNGSVAIQAGVAIEVSGGELAAVVANPATTALTYAATLDTNLGLGQSFSCTLTGNVTLANPTNGVPGQTYRWLLKQDSTGSRTLTLGSAFKSAGGAPALSTAASSSDRYTAWYDGASFWGVLDKAFA